MQPAKEDRRLISYGGGGVFHVPKPNGERDNLVPAYDCTIHKSQGSEYPAEVIPLLTQHYAMLERNLVYTGITSCLQQVMPAAWASPEAWQ